MTRALRSAITAALVGLGALLAPRPACAQVPDGGSVRYNLVAQTRANGATAYGAATAFEQWILPNLTHEGDWVFKVSSLNFTRATTVPGQCLPDADMFDACNGAPYVQIPVSLLSTQTAVGYRDERFGIFYAGSLTQVQFDTFFNGPFSAGMRQLESLALQNPALGPMGVLAGSGEETPVYDYVVGGTADVGIATVYAGYVGSKGSFLNVMQDETRLSVSSLANNGLSTLAYVKAGFDHLPLRRLAGAGADVAGMTSLFGRRIVVSPPRSLAASASEPLSDYQKQLQYSVTSLHLEQMSIAYLFDANVTVAFTKPVTMGEISAGVHTPGFHPVPAPRSGASERSPSSTIGAGLTVGVTTQPDLLFYGVRGGPKLSVDLTVRAPWASLSLQRNNPDILAVFPYAYDAWSIQLTIGTSSHELQTH